MSGKIKHIAIILYKLYKDGKWGNKGHTPIENVGKGFPKHLRGEIKKLVDDLIKKEFLIKAKHNYGEGVSLNISKLKEIEELIEEHR